jgi:hypothetical protein
VSPCGRRPSRPRSCMDPALPVRSKRPLGGQRPTGAWGSRTPCRVRRSLPARPALRPPIRPSPASP